MQGQVTTIKKGLRRLLDHTHFVKHNLEAAAARAMADMQGGFPDRNGEPSGVMSSDVSDTTSKLALGKADEVEAVWERLCFHVREAEKHMRFATYDINTLTGLKPEEAKRISDSLEERIRVCMNCQVIVSNTRDDRLKSGRCEACYVYNRRTGQERETPIERGSKKMYGTIRAAGNNQWINLGER